MLKLLFLLAANKPAESEVFYGCLLKEPSHFCFACSHSGRLAGVVNDLASEQPLMAFSNESV
jgi:hypothetical protein